MSLILGKVGEGRLPIYVGDDATDEDAFQALKDRGISIAIGESRQADYYLASQSEMGELLDRIEGVMGTSP